MLIEGCLLIVSIYTYQLIIRDCIEHNLDIDDIAPIQKLTIIGEECSICLDELKYPIRKTKCDHYFCDQCIKEWLQIKPICPNCNRDFSEDPLASYLIFE